MRPSPRVAVLAGAALVAGGSVALDVPPTTAASPDVVISQVYGGGGNTGATITNDFVELRNTSQSPMDVTGWSVQYASAAGSTWQVTVLSGTVPAGGYYLVEEARGAGGSTVLPAPDATGSIAMGAIDGPSYQYRQIDPGDNADGGQPGGNVRITFLFRTDRGLSFVDRPGGTATAATAWSAARSGCPG